MSNDCLFAAARHLTAMFGLPLLVLDLQEKTAARLPDGDDAPLPVLTDPAFRRELCALSGPVELYFDYVYYARLKAAQGIIIIGPFLDLGDDEGDKAQLHAQIHGCAPAPLGRADPQALLHALSLVYLMLTGQDFDADAYLSSGSLLEPVSQLILKERAGVQERRFQLSARRNDFKHENQLRTAIFNGDEQALHRCFALPLTGSSSELAPTALRAGKNQAIADITIMSRTAVDAGVNPAAGVQTAEVYIRAAEQADSSLQIKEIVRSCAVDCCAQVSALSSQSAVLHDELVGEIENYVQNHLQRKFTLQELGSSLHFSGDHLNRLYKKLTGRTIMQYARIARVEAAKPLLISAKYSAAQIAELTGFASQSHFVRVFRQITGMTPFKYQVRFEGRPFFAKRRA